MNEGQTFNIVTFKAGKDVLIVLNICLLTVFSDLLSFHALSELSHTRSCS